MSRDKYIIIVRGNLSLPIKKNKAGYTAIKVVCGWAAAVMKHANLNIWAGTVTPKTLKKLMVTDYLTDRQT